MPFTEDGVRPDLVVNPHALPSRMTIGHVIEALAGSLCCADDSLEYIDATMFNGENISTISRALKSIGVNENSSFRMRCPKTGRFLEGEVFVTPTFYQRLKHQVADKKHARANGARQLLSRQPLEGRSKGGGLRVGEMERDALSAHGATQVLLDRLLDCSDSFKSFICTNCGAIANKKNDCSYCNQNSTIEVNIPFALKLLTQELGACGVDASFEV